MSKISRRRFTQILGGASALAATSVAMKEAAADGHSNRLILNPRLQRAYSSFYSQIPRISVRAAFTTPPMKVVIKGNALFFQKI